MSLNPINEIGESPRSTVNSLSTSNTSSASSFSHLRAPISTSLPSYSSSASTYVGPVPERTSTEIGTSNTSTSTDEVWNNPSQQQNHSQNQNQNLSFIPQVYSNYRTTRATSFSSNNNNHQNNNNNNLSSSSSLTPQMERSHSTSTMYSFSSGTFHEKSLSVGTISTGAISTGTNSVKDNNSANSVTYTPSLTSISHHKMNLVYDTPVTSKELERMEQVGQQHDTWGSLVVKVLPLFNGEGLKLCIEDLNDLVR